MHTHSLALDGNTIGWTSYNLPSTITAAGQSSQFAYGPNRNRWRQIASYPSGTETTIYVGGILEKVTVPSGTAYRHYIGAGSASVLYTRWTTGTIHTKYVTADHLGSSTVVMDSAGGSLVNLSFGSYGARRGSNWTGTPSAGDWTQIGNSTRHGFTGHEALDNVNFVHMNGRVFEPVLGRFLSADPFMPGILGSQAPNRYAYVGNRPHSLVDPSGYFPRGGNALKAWRDGKMGSIAPWEEMAMMRAQEAWHHTYRGFMVGGIPVMQATTGRQQAEARRDFGHVSTTSLLPQYSFPVRIGITTPDLPNPIHVWTTQSFDHPTAFGIPGLWSSNFASSPIVRAPANNSVTPQLSRPQDSARGEPHEYTLDRTTVCSADEAFRQFTAAGMSAPGAPTAVEGFNPTVNLVFGNPITQTVDSTTRTIFNRTKFGHEFHDGSVAINVGPQPNDGSRFTIVGVGTNDAPFWNELVGRVFFGLVADAVSAQCAAEHGIPGRRSPGEY